jgi:hypothetical protein
LFVHEGVTRRLILTFIVLLAGQSAYAQPGDWSYGDRREGVHLRVLRDYDLPAGATAQEPIVVFGGTATIDGTAEDDVVVFGGTVRVGPTAVIRGDVMSMGGTAVIDPAARISGRVDETSIMGPDFDVAIGPLIGGWWPAFAFGATLLRLFVVLIVALLLTVVAPTWIQSIRVRAASTLASAGVGVASEVLFVPAVVAVTIALVVSVIGILALLAFPFLMGAAALMWVAGFTAVAINVGAGLRGRGVETSRPHVLDLLIGFAVISAVTLVAQSVALSPGALGTVAWIVRGAGWLIEWLAWTIGLGAALMALLGGRQPVTPPPLPFAHAATQS